MLIPTYNRTPAEFTEPFAAGAVSGLTLLHQQLDVLADPLLAQYRESNDLDAFAASYVGFFEDCFDLSGIAGNCGSDQLPDEHCFARVKVAIAKH